VPAASGPPRTEALLTSTGSSSEEEDSLEEPPLYAQAGLHNGQGPSTAYEELLLRFGETPSVPLPRRD
jgi:uncharacterized protein YqfA (UPF0365 family)